jgi:hypothetical protein
VVAVLDASLPPATAANHGNGQQKHQDARHARDDSSATTLVKSENSSSY